MASETDLPWWKKRTFAVVLGAAIPLATLAQGWMQKDRELALQERQQIQQFRTQYMSVLAEAGVEGIEVLADFIADTEQDPNIREWAVKQREKARGKIAELEKQTMEEQRKIQAAQVQVKAAAEKKKRAEARIEKLPAHAAEDPAPREAAMREAETARQEWATAQATAATSEGKLVRTKNALVGRGVMNERAPNAVRARPPEAQFMLQQMQQQP